MRELTRESLLKYVAADIDGSFARSSEYGDTSVQSASREFHQGLVAKVMWRLAPCVLALHAACKKAGADVEECPVLLSADTVMFAVGTPDPRLVGLAVQRGEERFVTFVRAHEDGRVAEAHVAAWKPDMGFALAALPNPLPTDPQELVRLSASLAPYTVEGGDHDLGTIAARVAAGKPVPYYARVAAVKVHDHEADGDMEAFTSVQGIGGGPAFLRYADVMAPALAHDPAPAPQDRSQPFFGGLQDRLVGMALKLDGGHVGPVCRDIAALFRGHGFPKTAAVCADTLARNADDLAEFGYVWGAKSLAYSDTDKRCFAIPAADPRTAALVHENIDLIADARRFLVVLHRGADGAVERLEAHVVAKPAAALLFDGDEVAETASVEDLISAADSVARFEDPEAAPPRLTVAEFARRLQAGEPLPPPAVGADLTTGTATPGTLHDASGLAEYFAAIAQNDRWILDRIRNNADRGIGCEDRATFGDEIYERAATPEADGPAMRR